MCTVTALPRAALTGGAGNDAVLRVSSSRDELRTRAAARPPEVHAIDGRRVIMPIDPVGGGTWIAATDRALVFALLNGNPRVDAGGARPAASSGDVRSRGLIIPALVSSGCVSEALDRALSLDVSRFNPFRLLMMDGHRLIECWPDAARLRHRRATLNVPLMRTTSSLGDALVQAPRRRLFRRFFDHAADLRAAQDAFHAHQWAGREAISVRMEREDALTVSRTTIEIGRELARVSYQPAGDEAAVRLSMPVAYLSSQ